MASGRFVAESASRDGSRTEVKLLSEALSKYRVLGAVQAMDVTEEDATVEEVNSVFSGTYSAEGAAGTVTGTIDLFPNQDDVGLQLLRVARADKADVNIRVTMVGKKRTSASIALSAGDSLGISAASNTKPYGEISLSGTGTNVTALKGVLASVGRGAVLKVGSDYYFVQDLTYNASGQVTKAQIGVGAGGTYAGWDGTAVSSLTGSTDIYGPRSSVRVYTGLVTALPNVSFSADDTAGISTSQASFRLIGLPVITINDPTT